MPTITLSDHEFWALISELELHYSHRKGQYLDIPEFVEEATESMKDRLRLMAGLDRRPTPKTKNAQKVWDAIKDASKGG